MKVRHARIILVKILHQMDTTANFDPLKLDPEFCVHTEQKPNGPEPNWHTFSAKPKPSRIGFTLHPVCMQGLSTNLDWDPNGSVLSRE